MTVPSQAPPRADRGNNFGLLRLILATLVIVAHSPEITDRDQSREILTRLFHGPLSLGDAAVDAFFLVSGYLITQSILGSRTVGHYIAKRVLQIYHGFVVASLFCIALSPLAGGHLAEASLIQAIGRMLALTSPVVPGSFVDLVNPSLNGPMWTISYEFRCYALVALAGCLGLFRRLVLCVVVLAALSILYLTFQAAPLAYAGSRILGNADSLSRFALMFACGAAFHLFANRIPLTTPGAGVAALALVLCLPFARLAEPAFVVCGGYPVFWFALSVPPLRLSRAANRTDLSYGIYFYAWPVQGLLFMHVPGISPWTMVAATLLVVVPMSVLSWTLIEKPALRLKNWLGG